MIPIQEEISAVEQPVKKIEEATPPPAHSLETVATDNAKENEIAKTVAATQEEKVIVKAEAKTEEVDLSKYSDDNPPAAVVLDEVAETRKPMATTNKVTTNTSTSAVTSTAKYGSSNVSVASAKLVSYGTVIKANNQSVYFIQLAALFSNKANLQEFNRVATLGNLYKIYESAATKIKLGYYYDEFEAKRILREVRNMGFTDAFISFVPMNTSNMELIVPGSDTTGNLNYTNNSSSTISKKYKVRLASYSDPSWFDLGSVSDLGTIEQWTKSDWTIFVLSGYSNYENAETARIRAVNRGYTDAKVVLDNGGVLETIQRN